MCYNWLNLNENLFWFFFLHLWCYFPPVFSSNLVQKLWPWINSGIATHFFLKPMAITLIIRNILLFPFLFSILIFFRSRFLHVWSLENKRLLHVIQLPARVRLVRQLEFISNSFDGGSSQVSIHQFFLLFLVSTKVNQLWNWIRCPSEFGDECYLLWL